MDPKQFLHRYLGIQRDALLAKLDGVGERVARWPMTPTGTNLLGLIKHVASIELGYFGEVFDRPSNVPLPWFDDGAEINADMWATADESREEIIALYQRATGHTDATIEALSLDAPGVVPWWPPERQHVTLHQILVHVSVEIARHAGHADIIRELIDGAAGTTGASPTRVHTHGRAIGNDSKRRLRNLRNVGKMHNPQLAEDASLMCMHLYEMRAVHEPQNVAEGIHH